MRSYIEAFKPKKNGNWYQSARQSASQLLTNPHILAYIDELLDININNSFVDKRLGFWITQLAHPSASMDAIKEYNKLKSRINEKILVKFEELTDDELIRKREEIVEGLVADRLNNRKKKRKQ